MLNRALSGLVAEHPSVHDNVNIISGDFVQEGDIVKDALAMDETYPEVPGAITAVGPEQVTATLERTASVPADAFAARVTDYTGAALPGAQVTYQISRPCPRRLGPQSAPKPLTAKADAQGDVNPGDALVSTIWPANGYVDGYGHGGGGLQRPGR